MTKQISNNEGQLYSMYIHSRKYRWIQDLSSIDKVMTIAPGNNGRLYVVLPRKSIVMGFDVLTGHISWQQSVGPLSNEKVLPAVDSNGKGKKLFPTSLIWNWNMFVPSIITSNLQLLNFDGPVAVLFTCILLSIHIFYRTPICVIICNISSSCCFVQML